MLELWAQTGKWGENPKADLGSFNFASDWSVDGGIQYNLTKSLGLGAKYKFASSTTDYSRVGFNHASLMLTYRLLNHKFRLRPFISAGPSYVLANHDFYGSFHLSATGYTQATEALNYKVSNFTINGVVGLDFRLFDWLSLVASVEYGDLLMTFSEDYFIVELDQSQGSYYESLGNLIIEPTEDNRKYEYRPLYFNIGLVFKLKKRKL